MELNPRLANFTICTLSSRCILHPPYSAALLDLTYAQNPELFCLTETCRISQLHQTQLHLT